MEDSFDQPRLYLVLGLHPTRHTTAVDFVVARHEEEAITQWQRQPHYADSDPGLVRTFIEIPSPLLYYNEAEEPETVYHTLPREFTGEELADFINQLQAQDDPPDNITPLRR